MRQCVLLVLLVAVCAAHPELFGKDEVLRFSPQDQFDDAFEAKWADYKETYGRKYETESEENVRKFIFQANLKQIEEHNILAAKGEKSFTMGINEYSDMNHEEFVKTFNGFKKTEKQKTNRIEYLSPAMPVSLPDEVDWRKHGYVTPVKNQGHCGSCWAFAATGCLEGQHMRKTGKLVSLSEQNLVDCSRRFGNHGCQGGLMDYAYNYIRDYGIDTEESYPYEAHNGKCRFNKADVGATDVGEVDLVEVDEDKLKEACATIGPISVAIDASHKSFRQYSGGIYEEDECSKDKLDHGVLIIGYGTENGTDYWLVKNSWGTSWGMSGYIKMVRNKHNACGIASMPSYPIV